MEKTMSLTPEQFRRAGLGVVPSPSPFFTPRPEKRRADLRGSEWSVNRQDKDKEVNVQVLLRCRPLNDEEQRMNVTKVISCNESKREVTVMQNLANKQVDRVFTFDKVFGPKAQQRSIYDQSIAPIVNEVLEGYNCTIFAYGQTGTGKTYTMEGGMRKKASELPAEAGVIPRAVRHIFDTLESQNADYSMKVTFLELYNEEVTDLLASEDSPRSFEDRQKRPISLMEDGKGCVVVRGLEEVAVYSANEIYTLLEQGAAKRRTADTLLNKRSSRSHSVFSIAVYIKEAAVGEEELIKCGKLNLVDLAGSENISRSGAREGRAKEAGEINKSLLTLGRVINALVEHSPHIPYRDSKLTRILRDSLGGKTKTCIIATISPSAHCLEETLSTLDYAYRAKNIKNKPEANQKMSKAVLLKDLHLEMEKLKEDIRAAREKSGVYISHDRFAQEEAEKKARSERIEELESSLVLSEKEVTKLRELYNNEQEKKMDLESELKNCKVELDKSSKMLLDLQEKHRLAVSMIKEKEFIISKLVQSENSLIERAKELRGDLWQASDDIDSLFKKLDHKDRMEADNHNLLLTFGSQLDQSLKNLHKTIIGSVSRQQHQIRCMEEQASSFLASKDDATQVLHSKVRKMMETHDLGVAALTNFVTSLQDNAINNLEHLSSSVSSQAKATENIIIALATEAKEVISSIQSSLSEQKELLAFSALQQEEGLRRGVISAQLISKATVDFFNDLQNRALEVMVILEKNHIQKSEQLTNFEEMFRDEAAREEKQALDQVAAILSNLTSSRNKRVSEAAESIHLFNAREKQRLHEEMSELQNVYDDAKKEMIEYMITTDNNFIEDTFSVAGSHAIMETCLQECSNVVDCSRQQWANAECTINGLNQKGIEKIKHEIKENIHTYSHSHEEFVSLSTSMDKDFKTRVDHVYNAINDSQAQDHDCKEKMDSMATLCMDQLHTIQEQHGQSILKVRTRAEQCLTKEYLVDQPSGEFPKKQTLSVPSLASIEEMRMSVNVNLKGEDILENISKYERLDNKSPQLLHEEVSLHRPPFADINS